MEGQRVLVAPLDWGLGHATRCIPLIQDLCDQGADVLLGCTAITRPILSEAFPHLRQCTLPDHNIKYSKSTDQFFSLLTQLPRSFLTMIRERRMVRHLCRSLEIDVIISDNRPGCRAKGVRNIFMTHQVNIKAPRFQNAIRTRFHRLIQKFDELWIPDHKDYPGLAGELSHGKELGIPTKFIGPLTRFKRTRSEIIPRTLIAVISGPEPQRSSFEKILLDQMEHSDLDCTIVRGTPLLPSEHRSTSVTLIDHLPANKLAKRLAQSEFIICRSGYSTIMDLKALERTAVLVPTPGQSEQEYLARLHSDSMPTVSQAEFDLDDAINQLKLDQETTPLGSNSTAFSSENLVTALPD